MANDPTHLGGAIDADGADKAARFLQLCDAFELPVLFLCDTPGFMVGPAAERTATVRHFARMFLAGANLSVPTGTIVLRKGYGLGAQAMAGGGFKAPLFTVAWPTSEFGAMGLEGAVRLGMRRELEAIEDEAERERVFEAMVAAAYERGRGHQHGRLRRDRRRDRPRRLAPLDRDAVRRAARRAGGAARQEAARTWTPGEARPPRRAVRGRFRSAVDTAVCIHRQAVTGHARDGPVREHPQRIFKSRRYPKGTGPKPMSHHHPTPRCA